MCAVNVSAQELGVDEALTIDATAGGVALASATIDPVGFRQAVYCAGELETAAIRMLDNGDAPTAAIGTPVTVGGRIELFGHQFIQAARFFRTTGVSGVIHFTCYGRYPAWVQ